MRKYFFLFLVVLVVVTVVLSGQAFAAAQPQDTTVVSLSSPAIESNANLSDMRFPSWDLAVSETSSSSANRISIALPIESASTHEGQANTAVVSSEGEGYASPPPAIVTPSAPTALPSLSAVIAALRNGQPGRVVGVYVPNSFLLRVLQQPADNPAYTSAIRGTATQFSLAAQQGTIGLLAHNYSSGALFFNLSIGQEVDIVYGDGTTSAYLVTQIRRLRALSPNDPYSSFIDLDNNGARLSSTGLFNQVYAGGNKVVFQTCIAADGILTWGRLFVTATPMR